MIINVGGRTDIINYYTPWLIKRLEEDFVYTRNPYNPKQLTEYNLSKKYVDAIIFCSKNYTPILDYIPSINKNYPIYCHYTITCYEDDVEPGVPSIDESITILKKLSEIIGSKKISWRYDPILLTSKYDIDYHLDKFEYMTSEIHEHVSTCIFSFVDMYDKVYRNMPEIIELTEKEKEELLVGLSGIAHEHGMPLQSCAVGSEYAKYGIVNSGCITSKILEKSNSLTLKKMKKGNKRKGCYCLPWRDIGEYDTCLNGCKYCYANKRPNIAKKNYDKHDPYSPLLVGHVKKDDKINRAKQYSFLLHDNKQQKLL